MMKIKIAETATRHGVKSAYALQKALGISPTIAARLWKGEFEKIGIGTLEKLCDYFQSQTNDFLEYPLKRAKDAPAVEPQKPAGVFESVKGESAERRTEKPVKLSDAGYTLTSAEVGEQLGLRPRTVREKAEKGELHGKQGKQNHWYFRQIDVDDYENRRS